SGALITLGPSGSLVFDGAPGHYQAVTGVIIADVAFDRIAAPPVGLRSTVLTLLTLDVRSNRPNNPTFVDLDFYNSNEQLLSTSTEFICWDQLRLIDISASLTGTNMGTRKGLFISGPAEKVPVFGIADTAGPVTILGSVPGFRGGGGGPLGGGFFLQDAKGRPPVPPVFLPNLRWSSPVPTPGG